MVLLFNVAATENMHQLYDISLMFMNLLSGASMETNAKYCAYIFSGCYGYFCLQCLLCTILSDQNEHCCLAFCYPITAMYGARLKFRTMYGIKVSSHLEIYYVPPALGVRRSSRFTVVSRHPHVCQHPCPRPCLGLWQTLFTLYFLQFFANGFQILRYGEVINCSWL